MCGGIRTAFILLAFLVLPAFLSPGVSAQSAEVPISEPQDFPLRPPDTSSPRDTLQTFLSAADAAIAGLLRGEPDQQAILRATAVMDFSTTVDGNTWGTRVRRVVLLREILSRIDLPNAGEIPGDREVAESDLTRWRIPDTAITLSRVERSPGFGEFLVSAYSVENLYRFYRQVRQLPAMGDAPAGAYETMFGDGRPDQIRPTIQERLRPVDTSTPLATFEGFLESVNRAHALIIFSRSATDLSADDRLAMEQTVDSLLQRAALTLDLREVPVALRGNVGIEAALQLKEIFDRLSLPPLDSIPDAQVVEAARQGEALSLWNGNDPLRWRYPNTAIEIVEITGDDRQGQFLFSAPTIRNLADYYEEAAAFPYRLVQSGTIELQYRSPEISPGFYDYYIAERERLEDILDYPPKGSPHYQERT
ncbi:MAG: hypothetical protein GVY13_00395 [Alphaproteobacteria bacterium]|jgi:MscS family membrane protein|nr:hypothetical protein [Alphaproteobacteria bacterium]